MPHRHTNHQSDTGNSVGPSSQVTLLCVKLQKKKKVCAAAKEATISIEHGTQTKTHHGAQLTGESGQLRGNHLHINVHTEMSSKLKRQ